MYIIYKGDECLQRSCLFNIFLMNQKMQNPSIEFCLCTNTLHFTRSPLISPNTLMFLLTFTNWRK